MAAKAHPLASSKGSVRDEWRTPQWIVDRILRVWPEGIMLDPCSNPHSLVPATICAGEGFAQRDGLAFENYRWPARTYVNPPYSDPAQWVMRCAHTPECMALLRCDPSVGWWRDVWTASAIAFFRKRVQFVPPPGVKASQNTGANVLALFNAPTAMQRKFQAVMLDVAHVEVRGWQ